MVEKKPRGDGGGGGGGGGGAKQDLSESDTAVVQYLTHQHRVREANCTEMCMHDYGTCQKQIKMVRTAVFYLKAAPETTRVRGPDGKFQSYTHPTLCYHCMEPCKLGDPCACLTAAYRTNPFYRDFTGTGAPKLIRNYNITKDMVRVFFKQLSGLPHDGCLCPCGQPVHRAADCHEMTCPCGFHICYYCGFAQFVDSPHVGIGGHFDQCPQYPCDVKLSYMKFPTHMKYPCRAHGPSACHGMDADCTKPTHRHWRDLYDANRKAAWAVGFASQFRNIARLAKTVEEELGKYPVFTDYVYV